MFIGRHEELELLEKLYSSKSGFTDEVIKRAEAECVKLITADELFEL